MNNFSFGTPLFGYYETIAGGSGAGPGFNGQSAVQTHMTNTRITDPEVLENRYPVLLDQFRVRRGSGGFGKFIGGNGVIREMRFLEDNVDVNVLSERRVTQPFGLEGGGPGKRGVNIWKMKEGRSRNIGSKGCFRVNKGDQVKILTPGGGGFGLKNNDSLNKSLLNKREFFEVNDDLIDKDDTEQLENNVNFQMQLNLKVKDKSSNKKLNSGSYQLRKNNQLSC